VSDEEPSKCVRLSLGWEGHQHFEFDSAALATLVEHLTDVGVVASITQEHSQSRSAARRPWRAGAPDPAIRFCWVARQADGRRLQLRPQDVSSQ
jgi:hypothetical protein